MKIIGKVCKWLFRLLLLSALLVVGIRLFVRFSVSGRVQTEEKACGDPEHFETILVLGAGVYRDGSLSPMLKARLDTAISLYNSGKADTIFVTGDHRDGEYDEVDHMIEYLVVNNVPEDKILSDYKGFSTYESMYRAAKLFRFQRVLVVTQQYHLYRAMYIGKSYGMDVAGVDAHYEGSLSGDGSRLVREWAATIKDLYKCIIQAEEDLTE